MSELHIGERIQKGLESHGFEFSESRLVWCGYRNFPELAGSITNGNRHVKIRISENYRWVEVLDGWDNIDRQIDLRAFYGDNEEAHAERLIKELVGGDPL